MRKLSRLIVPVIMAAVLAVTGVSCTKKAREARHLTRADKYFAAGDYDAAEIEYISVLKLDHTSARAFGQLGVMALEQGRLGRGYNLLVNALKLDPNNLDYHLKIGLFDLVVAKRKQATEEANLVLSHRPDDQDAPQLLADSAATLNEIDAARERLQKLVVPPAKRAPVEVAIATLDLREQDFKSGMAALERAKAADSKYAPLYAALGGVYLTQKDTNQAEAALKTSADLAPVRSPRRLKYAQFKVQNGDISEGKRILEDAVQKAPDYLTAWIVLGELSVGEKKYDDANRYLDKVLARDPQNYDALFLSGRVAMIQMDWPKAVLQFEKLSRDYQKSPSVFYQLGLAYNGANDIPKAMVAMTQAITLNPGYPDAVLALAQMKIAKGNVAPAIISLRQLVQQKPQNAQAQLVLANAYERQGSLEDAATVYRQLEEMYPKNPQVPLLLGVVLTKQPGQRREARKEFNKSLDLAPDNQLALERLTDLDMVEGNFSMALERAQQVASRTTNSPDAKLLIANIYQNQGKTREASAILANLVETHPDYGPAMLELAQIYFNSNQVDKALELSRTMVAKHPDVPGGWMLLGVIQDDRKDFSAARDAYEKVLTLDAKNSAALNNLAFIDAEHGELEKGYDLAMRARELMPYDPYTADTLGWILHKKGDDLQAVSILQESAAKIPASADIQFHLGMARYMLADEAGARTCFQYVVDSKTDAATKDEAKRRLMVLAVDPKNAGADARAILEKRIAEQPDDPNALIRLAAIYRHDGNMDKAIATYESALKANSKNVELIMDVANLYASRPNDAGRALELVKSAYKLEPDNLNVMRMLARLAYQTGDYRWSLNLFQDLARRQSADADLLYDLGRSAYSCGQVADAETDLRAALQAPAFSRATEAKHFLDMIGLAAHPVQAVAETSQVEQSLKTEPDFVPALMVWGIINEQKGDAHDAVQTYEKVLNRFPDFVPAKRQLAILYALEPGDDKKAYTVAIRAREAYPNDPEIAKALGIITYRQGNYANSASLLKESAANKTSDPLVMYYLGMDQFQLKQRADSKKNLLRAVELKLPDKLAEDAKKILAELK